MLLLAIFVRKIAREHAHGSRTSEIPRFLTRYNYWL
jgi:hypothetical protein